MERVQEEHIIGSSCNPLNQMVEAQQRITNSFGGYKIISLLGQGSYGVVWKALSEDDQDKVVAIKCMKKSFIGYKYMVRDRMNRMGMVPAEVFVLSRLSHKNIIPFVDFKEDTEYYYLVTKVPEECMDLFDFIELNPHLSEDRIRSIMRQLVDALLYMKSLGYVHRDIKDENIIIDKHENVYLIDFGHSHSFPRYRSNYFCENVGTPHAMAPEMIRKEAYDGLAQDVWALGILLFTLLYSEVPFDDSTLLLVSSSNDNMIFEQQLQYANESKHRSHSVVNLLYRMLDVNVAHRMTLPEISDHPWFKEVNSSYE